ncbi:hypothetical protein CHARACLAT_032791, partial [Characodon lateralis]|nr:hypothetical protein [Characodon lateralis]
GTEACKGVLHPEDFKSRVGDHPAGGDVTAVPDHSRRLRPQFEAGWRGNVRGARRNREVVDRLEMESVLKDLEAFDLALFFFFLPRASMKHII